MRFYCWHTNILDTTEPHRLLNDQYLLGIGFVNFDDGDAAILELVLGFPGEVRLLNTEENDTVMTIIFRESNTRYKNITCNSCVALCSS